MVKIGDEKTFFYEELRSLLEKIEETKKGSFFNAAQDCQFGHFCQLSDFLPPFRKIVAQIQLNTDLASHASAGAY